MANNKVLSLLGIAQRGRNVASGEFMTEKTVKEFSARLVIVAEDASFNTKKEFKDMCSFYEVPYVEYGTKESLAHAIGKEVRASLSVTDDGIARKIQKLINDEKSVADGALRMEERK